MTVRKFGQGWLRTALPLATAMIAAGAATPSAAQPSENPAPTPAPSSIFRLPPADDGRAPGVQGPSDNGLPPVAPNERRGAQQPAPTPAPTSPTAPPRVTPTQPTPAPTPSPAPTRRDPPAAALPSAAATPSAAAPGPTEQGRTDVPPLQTADPETAAVSTEAAAPSEADDAPIAAPPVDAPADTPVWAWILALVAALGAGLWYWRRRTALAGASDDAEADAPRPVVPSPLPRAAPPSAPRPAPATPAVPAPPPRPLPSDVRPASPLVTRAAGEQRAIVGMTLEIRSIRFAPDHVAVGFALNLLNQGSLPATGLMVRIALNQGSAMPEPVLGRFFDGAGGSVLRDDMTLAVGAGEDLSTEVMLPRAAIEPLMIGGKPMLVPVIAIDVTYHWDGEGDAFGQNAGSFVLGRAASPGAGDKLAPLPLDRASFLVDRPGARATAIKRSQ